MEESKDGKPAKTSVGNDAEKGGDQVDKWWSAISRLIIVQLCCGLLMQLSYVAFPAYNFALALWCLVCCTPKWAFKNSRLLPLHLIAIGFSIVTDIIWMNLWVSGRVFYDQLCGLNSVYIVSCGGVGNSYPGCQTNRFALFTLILNDLAKVATLVAMYRVHALTPSVSGSNHHHHHHHHQHSNLDSNSSSQSASSTSINNSNNARASTGIIHQAPGRQDPPSQV